MSSRSDQVVMVCGASGTTGGGVLRNLHEKYEGVKVKAQYHKDQAKVKSFHPNCECVQMDFNHIESSKSALQGVTSLFIVSPYSVDMLTQIRQLVDAAKENGVRQLVDAAKENGVRHIVHLGYHAPSTSTQCVYVHWHALCEKYIEASGMTWTHLRPTVFYENLISYGGAKSMDVKKGELSFPLQPHVKLPWISANDIGAVAAEALVNPSQHAGKAYPITSGIYTMEDIVSRLRQSVPQLKNLRLLTPSSDEFVRRILDAGGEPVYMTKGFKAMIDEGNAMGDCVDPGSKEGLEVVRQVGKKQPESVEEWAQHQHWG